MFIAENFILIVVAIIYYIFCLFVKLFQLVSSISRQDISKSTMTPRDALILKKR